MALIFLDGLLHCLLGSLPRLPPKKFEIIPQKTFGFVGSLARTIVGQRPPNLRRTQKLLRKQHLQYVRYFFWFPTSSYTIHLGTCYHRIFDLLYAKEETFA